MATYEVNRDAVENARRLIASRQYVLDSDWGDVQPHADAQNCVYRAAEWRHKAIEIAAHDLLQHLDEHAGVPAAR